MSDTYTAGLPPEAADEKIDFSVPYEAETITGYATGSRLPVNFDFYVYTGRGNFLITARQTGDVPGTYTWFSYAGVKELVAITPAIGALIERHFAGK